MLMPSSVYESDALPVHQQMALYQAPARALVLVLVLALVPMPVLARPP
jgi:hypothetical protein